MEARQYTLIPEKGKEISDALRKRTNEPNLACADRETDTKGTTRLYFQLLEEKTYLEVTVPSETYATKELFIWSLDQDIVEASIEILQLLGVSIDFNDDHTCFTGEDLSKAIGIRHKMKIVSLLARTLHCPACLTTWNEVLKEDDIFQRCNQSDSETTDDSSGNICSVWPDCPGRCYKCCLGDIGPN